MHFNSAVTLCALYFVTATQSIGLGWKQIYKIANYFKNINTDEISITDIEKIGPLIGFNNFSSFEYKKDEVSARKLRSVLLFLASKDKKTDDRTKLSLSSYEVRIYVSLFDKYDQWSKGVINYSAAVLAIDGLNLTKEDRINIVNALMQVDCINVAEFLRAILEEKPEGKGLNEKQIQDLIDLHNKNKITINHGNYINPVQITEFFKKLSIVKEENNDKLIFDPIPLRTAPLELQELLVVLAEFNKEADKEVETVISDVSVRNAVWDFSRYDTDKNGVLDIKELKEIARLQFPTKNADSIIKEFDTDDDKCLNIAEFFIVVLKVQKGSAYNIRYDF